MRSAGTPGARAGQVEFCFGVTLTTLPDPPQFVNTQVDIPDVYDMARNIYLGRTEAEWLQLFNEIKAEQLGLVRGDRFISVSTGGKAYQRRIRSRDEIQADYGEALNALQVLNPTAWGHSTEHTFADFGTYQQK